MLGINSLDAGHRVCKRSYVDLDGLLRECGMTLTELERSGVLSRMSVSRWRRGLGVPQRAACVRLALALGCDVDTVRGAVRQTIATARAERTAPTPQNEEPRT
jgi:transcriptional regulator with XRE-family HTH domain